MSALLSYSGKKVAKVFWGTLVLLGCSCKLFPNRITWIFKWRNKVKILTTDSTWFMFVKKTSVPKPVKSYWHTKYAILSNTRHIKGTANSISYICQKIYSQFRISETIWATWKKAQAIEKTLQKSET